MTIIEYTLVYCMHPGYPSQNLFRILYKECIFTLLREKVNMNVTTI